MNIQDLKHIKQIIQDNYNISASDAARVVGYINSNNTDIINNILSGDLSGVPSVLSALGIISMTDNNGSIKDIGEKTAENVARDTKTRKRSADNIKAPSSLPSSPLGVSAPVLDKIPIDDIRDHISQNNADILTENFDSRKENNADILPAVDGDIVPADDLPSGFGDTCSQWVEDYCNKHNIDITRLKSQQWRSACMYIGENIKQSHVLYDVQKIKKNGGRYYSGKKLELLLKLWAYLCGIYNQVPLVSDFINFSGVHPNYFYDYDGRGLSSTSVDIVKKARLIEEGGLGSSVAGGGAGAVGGMFLLKTRHGYSETVTIQHTSSAVSVGVGDLPLLGQNVDK